MLPSHPLRWLSLVSVAALALMVNYLNTHTRHVVHARSTFRTPSSLDVKACGDSLVRVGFAACNKHDRDQGYWDVVRSTLSCDGTRPGDAFAWLGDVVYADEQLQPGVWRAANATEMATKLTQFRYSAGYSRFRASLRREPTGVWDDHDMGLNDAGAGFAARRAHQPLFLDFLGVPQSSPRRKREGLYHLHAVPFRGHDGEAFARGNFDFAVCFVMLDTRYHRTEDDILGPEQWQWLANVLHRPDDELEIDGWRSMRQNRTLFDRCAMTAVTSGIQVLSDEKPTEHWGLTRGSRERLLSTLSVAGAERLVLLSGDVHYADMHVFSEPASASPMLVELTSSGLTHSLADVMSEELFDWLNFSPRRVGRYLGRTFGSISIDDSDGQLRASVRIHAVETGAAVLEHAFTVGTRVKDARPLSWPRQVPLFDGITKRAFAVFDAIPPQFQRVLGLHTLTTRHKAVERVAAVLLRWLRFS